MQWFNEWGSIRLQVCFQTWRYAFEWNIHSCHIYTIWYGNLIGNKVVMRASVTVYSLSLSHTHIRTHIHADIPASHHLTNHFHICTSYSGWPQSVGHLTNVGPSILWAYPNQHQGWGWCLLDTISKPFVCEIWSSWVICWAMQADICTNANKINGASCHNNIDRSTVCTCEAAAETLH